MIDVYLDFIYGLSLGIEIIPGSVTQGAAVIIDLFFIRVIIEHAY